MPRLTIDRAALKKGFWGNTWKNWGKCVIYASSKSIPGEFDIFVQALGARRPLHPSAAPLPPAGYIFAAFLVLYAAEAGYFTGMLFAAKRIRGHTYMSELWVNATPRAPPA